jgi:hypothetical protein
MIYEIIIRGYIRDTWFEELAVIRQPNSTTIIRGKLIDQASLYGILRKINDLGIELISVNRVVE